MYFKFKSDGSNNEWGFKIDIFAESKTVETNWLADLRDSCNHLLVFMNKSLINSSYDPERDSTNSAL